MSFFIFKAEKHRDMPTVQCPVPKEVDIQSTGPHERPVQLSLRRGAGGGVAEFGLRLKRAFFTDCSIRSCSATYEILSTVNCQLLAYSICTQTTAINRITYGIQGHCSRVPMPSLWIQQYRIYALDLKLQYLIYIFF